MNMVYLFSKQDFADYANGVVRKALANVEGVRNADWASDPIRSRARWLPSQTALTDP